MTDRRQIKILKCCLETDMEDWFAINQQVLPAHSKWADWRKRLLITFSDISWITVSHAYNFRYLSGSYIDFCVKKERLL